MINRMQRIAVLLVAILSSRCATINVQRAPDLIRNRSRSHAAVALFRDV